MSLRERREREEVEVKRGRPLGPTSSEGSFSSAARRRARACASDSAASTSFPPAAEACSSAADLLPSALYLVCLALVTLVFVFLEE